MKEIQYQVKIVPQKRTKFQKFFGIKKPKPVTGLTCEDFTDALQVIEIKPGVYLVGKGKIEHCGHYEHAHILHK